MCWLKWNRAECCLTRPHWQHKCKHLSAGVHTPTYTSLLCFRLCYWIFYLCFRPYFEVELYKRRWYDGDFDKLLNWLVDSKFLLDTKNHLRLYTGLLCVCVSWILNCWTVDSYTRYQIPNSLKQNLCCTVQIFYHYHDCSFCAEKKQEGHWIFQTDHSVSGTSCLCYKHRAVRGMWMFVPSAQEILIYQTSRKWFRA